jgi:hypothetical protein
VLPSTLVGRRGCGRRWGWVCPMGLSDRSTKFGALLSITGFVAALATSREARSQSTDDTTQSCVEPHQSAQQHRNAGDLLRSRDDLRRCSATTCPALIQNDCTTWLAQVVEAIPSVIFVAKLDDDGVFDVSVSVDGKPVTPQLDGKPRRAESGPPYVRLRTPGLPAGRKEVDRDAPREGATRVGELEVALHYAPPDRDDCTYAGSAQGCFGGPCRRMERPRPRGRGHCRRVGRRHNDV